MHLHVDQYLIETLYRCWDEDEHNEPTVFELYFRKNPFRGEYTIFMGLANVIKYLEAFKITESQLEFFKSLQEFSHYKDEFWTYFASLNTRSVKLYAMNEGSVCFPHEPLVKVIGPLGLANLIGTALLVSTGYPSLVATNATRYRLATDSINMQQCKLFEFGLRRGQMSEAALHASLSAYIGGFDATSNMDACEQYGLPICGTMDHTWVLSTFNRKPGPTREVTTKHIHLLNKSTNTVENFTLKCLDVEDEFMKRFVSKSERFKEIDQSLRRRTELEAFIRTAKAPPGKFLALVDTYDVKASGLVNFCIVALALIDFGYKPLGIRIDSGDLAYLSRWAHDLFREVAIEYHHDEFNHLQIVVSNEISIKVILSLASQKHNITSFGIGTDVVTCVKQPAHAFVYKMVELEGDPCQKSNKDGGKTMIACSKSSYRLYDRNNQAILDLLMGQNEPVPLAGHPILCRNPFDPDQKCTMTPARVEPLLHLWWDDGKLTKKLPTIEAIRANCAESLASLREDIKRFVNPTPFKVSVSADLYDNLSKLKTQPMAAGR